MPHTAKPAHTGALRVLIADDEHLVAAGLAATVRSLGHECVGVVASADDACASATRLDADIVLMDIRMPGTDGLAAAAALWERDHVPSVIVSAYAERDHIERSQQHGVFGYLIKPTSAQQLNAAITVAFARAAEVLERTERVDHLESTLSNRRTIERAKWHLVETGKITEADAHARIQHLARESRRRAVDVAAEILGDSPAPAGAG